MTSGSNDARRVIRKAALGDLSEIKALVDLHKSELGFVISAALKASINSAELIVATSREGFLLGFVHYRHRKDQQTTVYNLVVSQENQAHGVGTLLMDSLRNEAKSREQKYISLKCPQDLPANDFYRRYGFVVSSVEKGKNRPLYIWRLEL